jgi:crotonobetainyl-CoA:carnitine CoA-transferase CaiB-like acyl-CoA transferase
MTTTDRFPRGSSLSSSNVPVLDRLRVLDFTSGMAGPLATMVLADNGAEVIKIEPPEGDRARSEPAFQMWNRGKKSVVLDLRKSHDQEIARQLASQSDVLIESFRPLVADRFGIGYEVARSANPRLVYCSISGFGPLAQDSDNKGYEAVVSATSGLWRDLDEIQGAGAGRGRKRPVYKVVPVNSFAASQLALQGILSALIARDDTGQGQHVQTSLLQGAAVTVMRRDFRRNSNGGVRNAVTPNFDGDTTHRGIRLTFLTAECKDGKWIQMCARQDRHFRSWIDLLGLSSIFDDPRYAAAPLGIASVSDIEELEVELRSRMRSRTQREWMGLFQEHDIGADPYLNPSEFLDHPQMLENGRVAEIIDPSGRVQKQIGPLVVFGESSSVTAAAAPTLGEHTAEVLGGIEIGRPLKTEPYAQSGVAREGRASAEVRSVGKNPPPLDGITVIELAYFLAAPLAGAMLAELGARVIKVEPLSGDPFRRVGAQAARLLHGKESIALDLKSDKGRTILRKLMRGADVLYTNFRPAAHEKLGCDYASARAVNPNIVYLYAASYGSIGPWSGRPAFHSTPNALCGAGLLQAGAGNPPVDDSWPDPVSGLGAATAILLALAGRKRTGTGQYLETTMLCTSAYAFSRDLIAYERSGEWMIPDAEQQGRTALDRLYECKEGWLMLDIHREAEWEAFTTVIGHPEWAIDPQFVSPAARAKHDQQLSDLIAPALLAEPASEWSKKCGELNVPAAQADAGTFESYLGNQNMLAEASHPAFGDYWRTRASIQFSEMSTYLGPACSTGEHTEPILAELGYSPSAISDLLNENVVGSNEPSGAARSDANGKHQR